MTVLLHVILFQSANLRRCGLQQKKRRIRTQKPQDSLLAFLLILGDLEHVTQPLSLSFHKLKIFFF